MTALGRLAQALNAHDRSMNHARPHGEPDEALMSRGISGGDEQKHAQSPIHSNDHHQIVLWVSLSPYPARGPEDAQRIYSKNKRQADGNESDPEKKQASCIRHLCISCTSSRSFANLCQKTPRKTLTGG